MHENRLVQLIEKIHERTMAGRVNWEATAKVSAYQCAFSDFTIVIDAVRNRENPEEIDYVFSIVNSDGVIIEKIDDIALTRELDSDTGAGYKLMTQMYNSARRTAMGTERAIDALLKELGEE